jgi:hypothetical protein
VDLLRPFLREEGRVSRVTLRQIFESAAGRKNSAKSCLRETPVSGFFTAPQATGELKTLVSEAG